MIAIKKVPERILPFFGTYTILVECLIRLRSMLKDLVQIVRLEKSNKVHVTMTKKGMAHRGMQIMTVAVHSEKGRLELMQK